MFLPHYSKGTKIYFRRILKEILKKKKKTQEHA